MSDRMVGQTLLVDPADPLHAPQPKYMGHLPIALPPAAKISAEIDEATLAGLRIIKDAFRRKLDLDEKTNRLLLGAATAVLGNWARWQQTQTARWALQIRVDGLAQTDVPEAD